MVSNHEVVPLNSSFLLTPEETSKLVNAEAPCAYCGAQPSFDADHVVPRGLFAKPQPSNHVKVPCCRDCNVRKSDAEGIFRDAMITDINGCRHSTAWALAMTKLKSAVQKRKSPVARDLFFHGRVQPYHDAANLYLGDTWTVEAPRDGIHAAVEFITRGLVYALNRAPLPGDYEIVINRMPWLTMQREHDLAYEQGYGAIIVGNQPRPEFMGLFTKLPDDRNATRWIMTIYMNVAFEVYTASRDLLSQARSNSES